MKTILKNDYNLKEEEVTEVVKRVKVLLRNSKDELLLGYSHNVYQFIGGHVEKDEDFIDTINREILEEAGMELNIEKLEPFAKRVAYYKDYPENGSNRKIEIYYYEYKTDKTPDLSKTNYTEDEKIGNFELRYVPVEKLVSALKENIDKYGDIGGIASEMLELLDYYLNIGK